MWNGKKDIEPQHTHKKNNHKAEDKWKIGHWQEMDIENKFLVSFYLGHGIEDVN